MFDNSNDWLTRYMKMAFTKDSGIRKQDVIRVFYNVASNMVGQNLAWTYLRDEWEDITE